MRRFGINKIIFSWALFDFANSILITNGGLYFSQWLVVDNGVNDFWYNFAISFTSLIILLTAPVLGLISDRRRATLFFLWFTSSLMFFSTIVIGIGGQAIQSLLLRVSIALVAFSIINYSYQLSSLFYDSLLGKITSPDSYGRISGLGFASGWVGAVIGLIVILPFVQGKIPYFQTAQRINAFIPSALFFGVLTFISLLGLKGIPKSVLYVKNEQTRIHPYRQLIRDVCDLRNKKALLYFFIIYFLITNAILTIQANMPLYLEFVMKFSDTNKAFLIMFFLVFSALGGIICGSLADRVGLYKSLNWIIIGWIFLLIGMITFKVRIIFILIFLLIGMLFGALWTLLRAIFTALVPNERRSEYFGLYVASERTSAFFGPLLWGGAIFILSHLGTNRYRLAVLLMTVVLGSCLFFVHRLKSITKRSIKEAAKH